MNEFEKSNKILIKRLVNILTLLFTLTCIVFPAYNKNIKEISFIALLILSTLSLFIRKDKLKVSINEIIIFSFGLIMPTVFVVLSFITSTEGYIYIISKGISGYLFLVLIAIEVFEVDFNKLIIICLKILSIIIIGLISMDILKIIDINNNALVDWFNNSGNSMIGKGTSNLIFNYSIFMKASPLIIILLVNSLSKRDFVWIFLSLVSLVFSGTRANLFITVAIIIFWILMFYRKREKLLVISCILGFMLFFGQDIYGTIQNIFVTKNSGDLTRSGHLVSILKVLRNPQNLLFGQGFGTYFYSKGIGDYTNLVELSYFDLLRQIGLLNFILFSIFLIFPIRKLFYSKKGTKIIISYLLYLLIAYTNPLLYSSTGYIMYIYVYYNYFKIKSEGD